MLTVFGQILEVELQPQVKSLELKPKAKTSQDYLSRANGVLQKPEKM